MTNLENLRRLMAASWGEQIADEAIEQISRKAEAEADE